MYSIMHAAGAAGKKQMEVIQLFFRPQKMSHYVILRQNVYERIRHFLISVSISNQTSQPEVTSFSVCTHTQ